MQITFLFIFIILFVGFLMLHLYGILKKIYNNTFIKKKKIRPKAKKKYTLEIVLYSAYICIMLFTLFHLYEKSMKHDQKGENAVETSVPMQNYSAEAEVMIQSISFDSENINQKEIVWDHLLEKELGLENYYVWNNEAENFDQLHSTYRECFLYNPVIPYADYTELMEHCNNFWGKDLLPYTDRTLDDVTKEIPPPELRHLTSPDLFKEELFLRLKTSRESNRNNTYQIGRAADDTFKILVAEGQPSVNQLLFYSTVAVVCYQLTLNEMERDPDLEIENVDKDFLYYRMAEIFICLDENLPVSDGYETAHIHFLLCAESCLAKIQYERGLVENTEDINMQFPYFDSYYAEILFEFITVYGAESNDTIKSFYQHAESYMSSMNLTTDNEESCRDLKIRMDKYLGRQNKHM